MNFDDSPSRLTVLVSSRLVFVCLFVVTSSFQCISFIEVDCTVNTLSRQQGLSLFLSSLFNLLHTHSFKMFASIGV